MKEKLYLVAYIKKHHGEYIGQPELVTFSKLSDAERLFKVVHPNENVSDAKLFVCHEQNIDYLKEKDYE